MVEHGEGELCAAVTEDLGVAAEDRILAGVLDPGAAGVDPQLLDPRRHHPSLGE
jgi:hypothetical protein